VKASVKEAAAETVKVDFEAGLSASVSAGFARAAEQATTPAEHAKTKAIEMRRLTGACPANQDFLDILTR
jgi:hypothetical protein